MPYRQGLEDNELFESYLQLTERLDYVLPHADFGAYQRPKDNFISSLLLDSYVSKFVCLSNLDPSSFDKTREDRGSFLDTFEENRDVFKWRNDEKFKLALFSNKLGR